MTYRRVAVISSHIGWPAANRPRDHYWSWRRASKESIAAASPVAAGWDFSWLTAAPPSSARPGVPRSCWATDGRGRDRPWTSRPAAARCWPGSRTVQPAMVATESWPPNVAKALRRTAASGGVIVVAAGDEPPLPFADGAFDLVTSRHPVAAVVGRDRPRTAARRHLLLPAGRPGQRAANCSSTSSARARRARRAANPSRRAPRPRRPGSRSGPADRASCEWSSTTSAPWCTSCAR